MPHRLRNRLKFEIERFILYRSRNQLFLIAIIIALIALAGGLAAWWLTDDFRSPGEAVWWSFLRLTDPGYIGDDEGGTKRTISTVVSVLGYIFFLGALVAVMTQGLNQTVVRLQRGLTPIAQNDHILVLGWTNRTPIVIKQLLMSAGRVRSFLRRRGAFRLQIVVLAEEVTPKLTYELRTFLGPHWNGRQILLRSGTPLLVEHLQRVDFLNAAVIILPGGEFGEDILAYPDGRTVKALLSMKTSAKQSTLEMDAMPQMVAEINDVHKAKIAQAAYGGPIETLESDMLTARLIAQIIRNPGLSHIYQELLTHEEGNEIYLRRYPELTGKTVREAFMLFPDAVLLGLFRDDKRRFYSLTSVLDEKLDSKDRLVMIAPGSRANSLLTMNEGPIEQILPASIPSLTPASGHATNKQLLLLGWNGSTPALLSTLNSYRNERYEITNLALITPEEREQRLTRRGAQTSRISLDCIKGELTSAAEVSTLDLSHYDSIVIFASEWLETAGESDARTVLGYLVLQSILDQNPGKNRPNILAQLMNEANVALLPEDLCETLTSPVVLSHLLAQIALQRTLRGVFEELFGPGGAEIFFRSASTYHLPINSTHQVSFAEIQRAAFSRGDIAIGLRFADKKDTNGGILLNPPRDRKWYLKDCDDIVVLQDIAET